jgi:hypothetical protein
MLQRFGSCMLGCGDDLAFLLLLLLLSSQGWWCCCRQGARAGPATCGDAACQRVQRAVSAGFGLPCSQARQSATVLGTQQQQQQCVQITGACLPVLLHSPPVQLHMVNLLSAVPSVARLRCCCIHIQAPCAAQRSASADAG